ncbi:unnamed protein product [Durusdinium trenchii]|uniref:Uncharacterized protein n=1 Tax=Durusdinium trenchii TaxID=1381693 RepID=A0ABP0SVN3_9DINO
MGSTVRRRPNCFNLLFQMRLTQRMGKEDTAGLQAWNSASELAEAYQLGKMESGAAMQLLNEVDEEVVESLSSHVKKWSMGKFLTHEPVCNGIFNRDYTSGINALLPWEKDLKNSPESLALMCQRMELDYSQTFLARHGDAELEVMLEQSVQREQNAAAEAIATMLATATLKDTESKIEDDLARMKAFIQEATLFANQQGGLDLRYMTERYDRGKTWVAKYMEKHHRCCSNPLSQAHADLLHYQRGPLLIDEAVEVAKTVSNGDSNAILCLLGVGTIHKTYGFQKSKATLGTIGPVTRARVMDLWSEDDKPCSPPARESRQSP